MPSGWVSQNHPEGVLLASPPSNNGERCQIAIFKSHPSTGDLVADARGAFKVIFGMDPMANNAYPFPTATFDRGTAPQGWEYFVIQRSINGQVGDYGRLLGAHLLAARNGSDVAIVTWAGKDPLVSMCFGSLVHDQWPAFFYSLRFKNWQGAPLGHGQIMRTLAGTWTTATATAGDSYTFTPNGRYAGAGRLQTDARTTTTFGDGAVSLSGNTMTFKPDGGGTPRMVRQFRLEQESGDGGATWKDRLCLFEDGAGEICYTKQK
jgi:hypothetical protein